jgi:hypothetical protein
MSDLQTAVQKAVAKGLERPEAREDVFLSGVECSENEFRKAFRAEQKAFNTQSKPKAKAKQKAPKKKVK